MRLYHASTVIVEHPDVQHSRDNLDFGRGFYTTTLKDQAIRYAERYVRRGVAAYLNEYEFDEVVEGFSIKSFPMYNDEWIDYVARCRRGQLPKKVYDAVTGGIANDRVFNTIDLYFAGQITKEEALERLRFEKPNHQLCFLSNRLLDLHLHFIKAERI